METNSNSPKKGSTSYSDKTSDVWDILADTASKKTFILDTKLAAELDIDMKKLSACLQQIRNHCLRRELLPLHALVVTREELEGRLRGTEMDSAHKRRLEQIFFWIYDFDWKMLDNPFRKDE
ncbi:MAG: hypothetical protein R6U62_00805 [Bacteroidales bacterium]